MKQQNQSMVAHELGTNSVNPFGIQIEEPLKQQTQIGKLPPKTPFEPWDTGGLGGRGGG